MFEFIKSLFTGRGTPPPKDDPKWESDYAEENLFNDLYDDPNIIIDTRIRTKYRKGWIKKIRTKKGITEIVLHGTGGGSSISSLLRWMYNGERTKEYNKGVALFHYAIGRDGKIVEVLPVSHWVWHSSSGKHDKETIGIEMSNTSRLNAHAYTDEQYDSLFSLIEKLLKEQLTIKTIVGHGYNRVRWGRSTRKRCPGSGFDWKRLVNFLKTKYKVETLDKEAYKLVKKLSKAKQVGI